MSLASFTIDESLDVSGDTSGCIFFCILKYALLISSLFNLFFSSKFKILYYSETDKVEKLLFCCLLNENLPFFLRV